MHICQGSISANTSNSCMKHFPSLPEAILRRCRLEFLSSTWHLSCLKWTEMFFKGKYVSSVEKKHYSQNFVQAYRCCQTKPYQDHKICVAEFRICCLATYYSMLQGPNISGTSRCSESKIAYLEYLKLQYASIKLPVLLIILLFYQYSNGLLVPLIMKVK